MKLKLKISKEEFEKLDDSIKALYTEKDGAYALEVEGVDDAEEIKRALEHERGNTKESKAEIAKLQKQLKEIEDEKARKNGDIESIEKSWQEKLQSRESEFNQQLDGMRGYIKQQLIDKNAHEIATRISTSPKLLMPHIKSRISVDFEGDEPKARILDNDGKPSSLTFEDLEKEFSSNSDYSAIIIGSKASGGGGAPTNGSGGGAPFDKSGSGNGEADLSKMSPEQLADHIKNLS